MYILGQQGIARGVRSVNRDHVLQLLEVSISYPFSYFSPLFLWNIKFDRFYFLDVFFMATQKNESKKLGFSCFCGGWWVRTCSQKKMAEGPLVCHFSGEMRPCVGWGTVPDFTSPPSPCTTPQQVLLREADSFVLKGFYPISRGPVLDGPGWCSDWGLVLPLPAWSTLTATWKKSYCRSASCPPTSKRFGYSQLYRWREWEIPRVFKVCVTNNEAALGLAFLKNEGCVCGHQRTSWSNLGTDCVLWFRGVWTSGNWSFFHSNSSVIVGNHIENILNTFITLKVEKLTALMNRLECILGWSTLLFLKFNSSLTHSFNRSLLSTCHVLNFLISIWCFKLKCQ